MTEGNGNPSSLCHRCAMYRTIKPNDTITMWDIRHNTIAGDCAVTVFIQVRQAPACQAACGRKEKKTSTD